MNHGARMAARRAAVAVCVVMAGCATPDIERRTSAAEVAGLFRTSSRVGELAPAPTAGWYVPRQTPHFVKMGLAREAATPQRGWLGRLLFPQKVARPTAVIAETAALPLPSVVQLENVATGATLRVRIDARAPMGEDLVRLNAEAAQELGVSASQPLLVRVRFVEPAIAYRQGPPLTYALNRKPKDQTQLAAAPRVAAAPMVELASTPADAPVVTARLERPTSPEVISSEAPHAPPSAPMMRVQAGAFANAGNARRAVTMLTSAGAAQIQPVRRADGLMLYRVFVDCQAPAAEAVRAKVVSAGFADARIVRAAKALMKTPRPDPVGAPSV